MSDESASILGRGWAFPPTFQKQERGVAMVSEEEDVRQSLELLLHTRPGERHLENAFGCNLDMLQFEPLDTTLRTYVRELVRDAILYFEPRVVLESVDVATHPEGGRLDIDVRYRILSTNRRNNLVFPFYLDGTRGAGP